MISRTTSLIPTAFLAVATFLCLALSSFVAIAQDEGGEEAVEEPTTTPTDEATDTEAAPAEGDTAGQEAYAAECARCHGDTGQADARMSERLGVPAFTTARMAELGADGLRTQITEGHGDRNPAEDLTAEQLDALIAYVQTLAQ